MNNRLYCLGQQSLTFGIRLLLLASLAWWPVGQAVAGNGNGTGQAPQNVTDYVLSNTPITTCSGIVRDHTDTLNYRDDQEIRQVILPGTANQFVQITFLTFRTEDDYDRVYVYDGGDTLSPLLGVFSGRVLPPVLTAANPAGKLCVRFHSDHSINYKGFSFSISCALFSVTDFTPKYGYPGDSITITGANLGTVNSVVFKGGASAQFRVKNRYALRVAVPGLAVSGPITVNASSGSVTTYHSFIIGQVYTMSGNRLYTCDGVVFDHDNGAAPNYSSNTNLVQEIFPGTPGKQVRLTFLSFRTEPVYDTVTVYNGDTTAPVLGTYSGENLPPVLTATNNQGKLTIRFTTDASVNYTGFSVGITCVGFAVADFNAKHGQPGDTVTLTGNNLGLVTKAYFNGTATNFRFVDYNTLKAVVPPGATTGRISLVSIADSQSTDCDFIVGTFYTMQQQGLQTLTVCNDVLTDHDGGCDYANYQRRITVLNPGTPGKTLLLQWQRMRLATGDVVKVYDGDQNGPLIGTYSGTILPADVWAENAAGKLTIVFTSNQQGTDVGFSVKATCIDFLQPGISGFSPATVRSGFPFAVFTTGTHTGDSLFLDGVYTGAQYNGAYWQGFVPQGASAGMFSIKNRLGTANLTAAIQILPGNYCVGTNSACPAGGGSEYIAKVSIAGTTLNHTSACNDTLAHNNIVWPQTGNATATLHRKSTYTLSVTTGAADMAVLWADWNQNQVFEPSEYRRISYQTTAGTPATVSFTVPDSAAFGNTVLRVRTVTAGNIIDTADACVPFLQGESEDYTVTVASPVGISTAAGTGKLLLWPNPNNGGCEVSLAGLNGGGTLKITDALGRTVYSTSVSGSAGQYALQTHNLPKGMYLTELSGPGFVRSSLMVVQ